MPHRPTHTVTRPTDLAELCHHLRGAERFAFDTEFVTEETFYPVLCLVQVATPERLAIIDPFEAGDLDEFWSLVSAPPRQVTAHAADAEIRFCRQHLGREPAAIFDVQIAAGLAGFGYPLSYTNLVRRVAGDSVKGTETRTDWRRRPLTEKQLSYALEDVRYLLLIRDRLTEQLDRSGRLAWADEEFQAQVAPGDGDVAEPWRKVSGFTSLNRRQMAVLRELAVWRIDEAKRRDRPIRTVAADDVLLDLAKRQPHDMRDLFMFRGMNRRNLQKVSNELLDAVRRGGAIPDAELPALPPKPEDSDRVRMLTGVLSTALVAGCTRENLPPALVASTNDLAALARGYIARGELPESSPLAVGWRRLVFGDLLLDLLEGRRCLRIVDPRAAMPVAIDEVPRSSDTL